MRASLILIGLVLATPAYAASCPGEARVEARYLKAVTKFVSEKYAWPKADYCIELRNGGDKVSVFTVLHADDDKVLNVGGGKSFELHLDSRTLRVLREMFFQ